jgi:hypothetical protein
LNLELDLRPTPDPPMEIHAPHNPIHTKRDFFLHLFTITVGLLIALSLEGLVEFAHHRHLVREARENIRRELQLNHEAAQADLDIVQKNIDREKSNIAAIHGLMTDAEHFRGSIHNTWDFDSLNESAWHTARETGALGYMPYDEVQRYSDLYMLEDLVNNSSIAIAKQDFTASAPFAMGYDIDKLPPDEYLRLLQDNANIEVQVTVLKQLVKEYDDAALAELKK